MIRPLLLSAAGLVAASAASAQQSRAHMEACTEWESGDGRIVTRNDCNRPVTILFMAANDGRVVEADVPPGGWFDSGVGMGNAESYIFTVCPFGYVPSVRFSRENGAPIAESLYNCLPKGRPGV